MTHKHYAISFLFLVLVIPAWGKVVFSGLNLAGDNRMLFRADSDAAGSIRQDAVFVTRLTDLSLRQITAFPEKMELVENGKTLQVRNAFGVLRIPVAGGLPRTIPGFPAFADGASVLGGRVEDIIVSRDGRWILYVEPVTAAYGNLLIINTETGSRTLVSANVERPDGYFPACWSPDSRVFVYSRGNRLYYHNVNATFSVDERYRTIGEGTINSVYWTEGEDFFYLRGSTVYRVRGSELFARTVYADFLEIGSPIGKIPYEFDYNFDAFWISPDSRAILFSKGGQNVFYYPLGADDYSTIGAASFPYIMLPRSGCSLSVLWSPQGQITALVSVSRKESAGVTAYRLGPQGEGSGPAFQTLEVPAGSRAALSPDGTLAVLWGEQGVILYDYASWRVLRILSPHPAYACLWLGNQDLIIGDGSRIERIRLDSTSSVGRELICVSSADNFGFEEKGDRILARSGGVWYVTDGSEPWAEASASRMRPVSVTSGRYRVYLERLVSGPYENIPMIRNIVSFGTSPLLPGGGFPPAYPDDGDFSEDDLSHNEGELFTHSRRRGVREAAVCFDLYDDITGLPGVLETLRHFGIKATFFLNGEFIRRHPAAVRDIAEAGHETASMFFVLIDLSDSRYRIQSDFIARGLARNEDEFFSATGKELSLIWHAPHYFASTEIAEAAFQAGYITVGRDVDPLDWIRREDERHGGVTQYAASDMVDRIMEQKRPGSIIPIRLGLLAGGRSDYLYNRIGVLLDALIREGYSMTTVSTLIEHAR
jgi:peptidoglycan/xylan/chitin deacetylase (PgdA/CDA1 family)/WD40 repeat protein